MNHEISEAMLTSVIETLKGIKVRGFDSMNRLVGLVMFFENIFNQPPINEPADEIKEEGSEE